MAELCGATAVDLLGKTVTCVRTKGHARDHESERRVFWEQEDEALAVLRELLAVRRGDGELVDRLRREQAAWDRAGRLVDGG